MQTSNSELGIWIREDYHYHGYGREAVTAVAKWAIDFVKPDFLFIPSLKKTTQVEKLLNL